MGERDSGKFNYHLRKLVGHFVAQDEDGYRLSFAGEQVYGAILSGAYTANASVSSFEFEGPCPMCGHAALVAEYRDEMATLACPNCEEWRNEFLFPPGTLDQFARRDLPFAFDCWMRSTVVRFLQGFCGNCGGRVDAALERSPSNFSNPVRAVFEWFFERRGVDVLDDPSWRYHDASDDVSIELVNDDPPSARVSITVDGARLVATIDSEVAIEDVETDTQFDRSWLLETVKATLGHAPDGHGSPSRGTRTHRRRPLRRTAARGRGSDPGAG